jgi:predicted RNase H-like nuclease (RuvC/YqgF family)
MDNLNDFDYKKMTTLTKYDIEDHFIRLPGDIHTVSDLAADQQQIVSDLKDEINYEKERMKALKANIELQYRTGKKRVIKDGKSVTRPTDNFIKALVENSDEVAIKHIEIYDLQKELNKQQRDLDKLQGTLKSLQGKKEQLSNLESWTSMGLSSINLKPKSSVDPREFRKKNIK